MRPFKKNKTMKKRRRRQALPPLLLLSSLFAFMFCFFSSVLVGRVPKNLLVYLSFLVFFFCWWCFFFFLFNNISRYYRTKPRLEIGKPVKHPQQFTNTHIRIRCLRLKKTKRIQKKSIQVFHFFLISFSRVCFFVSFLMSSGSFLHPSPLPQKKNPTTNNFGGL